MNTIRVLAALLVLTMGTAFASSMTASASAPTRVVSFQASYTGTASLLISSSSVEVLSVKGRGSATLLGTSTVSGTANGAGANGLCVPFSGKGTIKSSVGTLKLSAISTKSQGCSSGQSGPVTVTVTGSAKVTGGTGKASGAKGTLTFKGKLLLNDTTGAQTGTFKGKLSGKLTVK